MCSHDAIKNKFIIAMIRFHTTEMIFNAIFLDKEIFHNYEEAIEHAKKLNSQSTGQTWYTVCPLMVPEAIYSEQTSATDLIGIDSIIKEQLSSKYKKSKSNTKVLNIQDLYLEKGINIEEI